jgi:hypothetical protein
MIAEKFAIVRWTYDAAGDGGESEFHGRPPVTAGLIVIGSDDQRPEGIGYVYAFDRHSLSRLRKRWAGTGVMADVVGCGGTAYVVTLGDELLALDLDSGVVRWRFASGASNPHYFANSTPVIVGDRVIFGGLDGSIRALSTRSGSVLWQRDLGAWISTSVAAIGDDLYVGDSLGRIHKLDAATGASRAWLTIDANMGFRLLPAGRSLLVFANEDGVTTLKSIASTLGAVNWTRSALGLGWTSFGAPYVWKDWVVVGRGEGRLRRAAISRWAAGMAGESDGPSRRDRRGRGVAISWHDRGCALCVPAACLCPLRRVLCNVASGSGVSGARYPPWKRRHRLRSRGSNRRNGITCGKGDTRTARPGLPAQPASQRRQRMLAPTC